MRTVGILLFDDVEVLDFAGPFEIFSVCGLRSSQEAPFSVFTFAENEVVVARNHLTVKPTYSFENVPRIDILIVPGGGGFDQSGRPFGTRKEMNNPRLIDLLKSIGDGAELILSVCTGSLILAKAGFLTGLKATTHFGAADLMREVAPDTELLIEERWVDNGKIILSAGIAAGMDMSFYVITRLLGPAAANETAQYMQFDHWKSDSDSKASP
jgi:transcriptional regulator GlxA family with amidase domain